MMPGIDDSDCEKLRKRGLATDGCCCSCHDHYRADTELSEIEIDGETFVVCCHIEREILGITFEEALGIV